jgi:hypothetical protein
MTIEGRRAIVGFLFVILILFPAMCVGTYFLFDILEGIDRRLPFIFVIVLNLIICALNCLPNPRSAEYERLLP